MYFSIQTLQIAICTFSLLLTETLLQSVAHFTTSGVAGFLVPLLIFSGLSVGNTIRLLSPKWTDSNWITLTSFALFITWSGMSFYPKWALLWISLPFLGYGALFVNFFTFFDLKQVVVATGIAGVIFFACYEFLGTLPFELLFLINISSILLLKLLISLKSWRSTSSPDESNLQCADLFSNRQLLMTFLFLSCAGVLYWFNTLEIQARLVRDINRFKTAIKVEKPEIHSMFRTDLVYLPALDVFALMMNGTRFGSIPPSKLAKESIQGNGHPLKFPAYDTPYLFGKKIEKTLVIGPAEGQNVLAGLAYGSKITAVDINPGVFHFLRDLRPQLLAGAYTHPNVKTVVAEGRHYLQQTNENYDLITLQGVQTGNSGQAMSTALLESYLFTEEALKVLWSRLTDNGALFFDEYKSLYQSEFSLIVELSRIAKNTLPITESNNQIVLYEYLQATNNPQSSPQSRNVRQGLLIFKKPVADLSSKKNDVAKQIPIKYLEIPDGSPKSITDNRPFFVQVGSFQTNSIILFAVFLFLLIVCLIALFKSTKLKIERSSLKVNFALFLLGATYIILVMSFVGPLTLIWGDPLKFAPVMYFVFYFAGLVSGLIALNTKIKLLKPILGCCIIAISISAIFTFYQKPVILTVTSDLIRYSFVIFILSILAIVFEFPYIMLLKSQESLGRGISYTFENLGTLFGAAVSLIGQIYFGFIGSLVLGVLILIGVFLISLFDTEEFKVENH